MSIYTGDAPYSTACDKCDCAGPTAFSEDEAMNKADAAGWACSHGDDCNDYCPECVLTLTDVVCGTCPWCRAHNVERAPTPDGAAEPTPEAARATEPPTPVPPARELTDAELGALAILVHQDIVVAAFRVAAGQATPDHIPSKAAERLEAELKRRGIL